MTTPKETDTLKVHEFRPRSSSEGPAVSRENNEQLVISNKLAKITLTECAGNAEQTKTINNNNNNFLKCPTVKKLTTSRSNPQLGEIVKEPCNPVRRDRPLIGRGTLLKLMDIPPPDYDQIRRSLSPCRLSPEAQSILENF